MDIVIIEDENLVSEDLAAILKSIDNKINIIKIISSVKEAIQYFKRSAMPQLIFSDIQLGDGHSFEIFQGLENPAPVIYCTAFNQHALQAFQNNGIAYVLKPYTRETIKQALEKYLSLKKNFSSNDAFNYGLLITTLTNSRGKTKTILVNNKNKIIPVKLADIVFFVIENKTTIAITFEKEKYPINNTLDELENICGGDFFRANRQLLIGRDGIKDIVHYGFRKLFVNLCVSTQHEIIINKEKSKLFLDWLKG